MAAIARAQDDIDLALAETAKVDAQNEKNAQLDGIDKHELSSVHDVPDADEGLEFPTEEELATLVRVSDTLPWASYLIAAVEMAERFSFYGCSVVFTNFIQQSLPPDSRTGAGGTDGQSGALGMGQQTSTGLTTFYSMWCYITPLWGAYLADAKWGRYNTICVGVVVAMLGHIILIISAIPGVIEKQQSALACFVIALIIMGLGTGMFKANISPLVAEQYTRNKLFIRVNADGSRVIVDPAFTVSRMYMYFYFFINIGALIGQIGMAYAEKYVGFWLAYTLPTAVFFMCPFILFIGRNKYVRTPPTESVLARALKLWVFAAKGRWSLNPIKTYKNLRADDFWESVKPSHLQTKPHWMNFDDFWVDEVRRGFKACSVFLWFPIFWLSYNQINNNLTSQAATMATHGVPNDVLSNLDPFAILIIIPLCDVLIYPFFKTIGFRFTALRKMAAGFACGCMAMIWAATLQHYIYKTSPCGYYAASCKDADGNVLTSPINVWAQTGAYVLVATSEIFASITGLEYAFTKAPKNMRSLVMAVFFFTSAIAYALSEAFLPLVEDPMLVWNYGVVAVIAFVAGILYWLSVRKLDAQEDELNNMPEGHVDSQPDASSAEKQ
ncbi:PTR2-domain-containing protein [Schizophyllum amplum]|uniref:PTR2-domain-containing protein n=1 Tax=Schizophyllum amplum TaxID=97359 RepID=A0A550C819_9AGAR|nr:PTR2-domain-containing protein [Auriculariopsis ampla]